MNLTSKHAVAAIILALSVAAPAAAGPLDDAEAAIKRRDYATAVRLVRPLAEQGDANAQYNLGVFYDNGLGVPQDKVRAYSDHGRARLAESDRGLGAVNELDVEFRHAADAQRSVAAEIRVLERRRALSKTGGRLPTDGRKAGRPSGLARKTAYGPKRTSHKHALHIRATPPVSLKCAAQR